MDSNKPSLSSKALQAASGGGNESQMEEGSGLRQDNVDGELRETDVVDGTSTAEINHHQRGSADKNKFNTLGYQRRTKQKVVTDFATLNKGTSSGVKPRAALRQVLFSQGVSDKNPPSEERGQLDVLKQDLQAFAVPVSLKWRWREDRGGTTLEKNWTDIVQSHSTMAKMQRHQQEALWEFVHTELTYINKLIIIKDLVIAALVNLHQHGFLLEVTPELLFSNLHSILSAHQLFWQEVIYPMLEEVRSTGKPFDPMRLEAGCLQFHERFSCYQHYCWEEENNLEFTRRQMESNPHFLTYVQWVESHPQCERMRLGDMQAKPHQRITKYPLLLKAVLKTTQDIHVQHKLRGMLSSANSFLESINDYLKLRDEELALSISAQRVEGYEVEGINDEIDKHVREICQFNLTCPVRGVGPEVVRKLLLEENLKIRDRKDSKLDVVALLFSDVLLMTKVQKKGERLKVVRPPLALDKTSCIALKDGCAFVLVEVGELQSPVNVYIFAASTSERCSTWVSTINQAKETLANLRKSESDRQLESWRIQFETRTINKAKRGYMVTEKQPQAERETFVRQLTEKFANLQSMNGMLESKDAGDYQPGDYVASNNSGLLFLPSQISKTNHTSGHKSFTGLKQLVERHELIKMGVRQDQDGNQTKEEKKKMTIAPRAQSAPNLDLLIPSTAEDPTQCKTAVPNSLSILGLPAVDYPTDEESTLQLPHQQIMSRERSEFQTLPGEGGLLTSGGSPSVNHNIQGNPSYSQSESRDTSPEAWGLLKDLKSPGLRRRRPGSLNQSSSTQASREFFQGSGDTQATSNNSCSNSDLDCNSNYKRNSLPCNRSSRSHRVLKLGSLKPNQSMFWYMNDRDSSDPQTLSESELPDLHFHNKKTKRSASIPNVITERENGLEYAFPQERDTAFGISEHYLNRQGSPLEGFLKRAKGRVRERAMDGKSDALNRRQNVKMANFYRSPSPSPSFSTTPSTLTSDGHRDTDWEEEVKLMRHRALTVSQGWKEQLVDGDEDDNRSSLVCTDGVNVDWPGWCFDDEEVMNSLHSGAKGPLGSISRSLASSNVQEFSEQEDGECSQV
ncbi:pleckstrin homology domain-containing family G member 5 [Echeneis naucrates]|uniref:DH domain-containing protein n=1 Tax=Echeneis naucrates TaxID=173247 RepID=A0A665TW22_ECHNA|nr:pleckstrin homology domain-containing family G member 6 [Echeneis naucrates]